MNERIKKLFVCIRDNKVIAFETNLKSFHQTITTIEPEANSYAWFRRQLIKTQCFTIQHNGKEYTIQQLV